MIPLVHFSPNLVIDHLKIEGEKHAEAQIGDKIAIIGIDQATGEEVSIHNVAVTYVTPHPNCTEIKGNCTYAKRKYAVTIALNKHTGSSHGLLVPRS